MSELINLRAKALLKMKNYRAKQKALAKLSAIPEDGYWCWLIQEDYEFLSESWKKSLGYEDCELENRPETWMELIDKKGLQDALANVDKHFQTRGQHPYHQVVNYICKDGSIKTYICNGEVTKWDDNGKPLVMIGTHEEVVK
jgi:PAS domain S-box-containing protein